MPTLTLILASLLGSLQSGITLPDTARPPAVIIAIDTAGEFPAWSTDRKLSLGLLREKAKESNFDLEIVSDRCYILDQRLFRLENKKRYLLLLAEIGAVAAASSATFGVAGKEHLARFAAECFAPPSMNFVGVEEAKFTILPTVGLGLSDGTRSISLYLQPNLPPDVQRELEQQPLRPSERPLPVRPPGVVREYDIGPMTGLRIHSVGREASLPGRRTQDLTVVAELLAQREGEWAERLRTAQLKAVESLRSRYPEFDESARFAGPTSAMPAWLKKRMTDMVIDDYRGYGFESEAEAAAFLARANARGTPFPTLVAANTMRTGGFGLVQYGLPIP